MKLKKIASVIAAVAMAATLCMPAFADATPGEIANNAAEQAAASQDIAEIASYVAQATESLKLSSEPVTVSVPVTSQAIRYFDMAEEKGWVNPVASGDIIYRCDNGATVNASCNVADDYTITIDATASGDSAHGYALSVKLPLDCNVQTYTLSETSGQVSFTATADVINVGGEFKMVTFWVPHFTTYVLTPASVSGGNSSSGSDDNNSSSNNSSNYFYGDYHRDGYGSCSGRKPHQKDWRFHGYDYVCCGCVGCCRCLRYGCCREKGSQG